MAMDPSIVASLLTEASLDQVTPLLEHLAWRSILAGRRVGEYCADLACTVRGLDAPTSLKIRTALATAPLPLLYPLARFPSSPHLPSEPQSPPFPLLPTSSFANATSKQVIDALVKASHESSSILTKPPHFKKQVQELCLEYIGSQWRSHTLESDLVESIGRVLNEVEFEVQLQGHHVTVQSHIRPIFHQIRHLLGLGTWTQIVRRLNALEETSPVPTDSSPSRLFSAWITIRLLAGMAPRVLVDQLTGAIEDLKSDLHKISLCETLRSLGLVGPENGSWSSSLAGLGDFGIPPVQPHSPLESPLLPSLSPKKLHSPPHLCPSVGSRSAFKWWSHKRNSSSSKVHNKARLMDTERRPSLPLATTSAVSVASHFPSPLGPWKESTSSLGSSASLAPTCVSRLSNSVTATNLASSIVALDSPDEACRILRDHLLGSRYKVTGDPKEDWYLGNGKGQARQLLASLEAKFWGKLGSTALLANIADFRYLLGLTKYSSQVSCRGFLIDSDSAKSTDPEPSSSIRRYGSPPSTSLIHHRDTSFDLNQYLCDITPSLEGHEDPPPSCQHPKVYVDMVDDYSEGEKDKGCRPRGKSSVTSSVATSQTPSQIFHGASRMSSIVIREATREYPHESFATRVRLSSLQARRVSSMVNLKVDVAHAKARRPVIDHANLPPSPDSLWRLRGGDLHHSSSPPEYKTTAEKNRSNNTLSFPSIRRRLKAKGHIVSRPSAWQLGGKTRPPPLPIATPTLPSLRRHGIPSPNIGMFGELGTPPQTPPCPTPRRLLYELSTPRQIRLRKSHREWTIVDGAQISPPRIDDLDSSGEGLSTALDTPGLFVTPFRDFAKPLPSVPPVPPAPPSLTLAAIPHEADKGPVLAKLLSIFENVGGTLGIRSDIKVQDFECILQDIEKSCEDSVASWIMDQVSKMVNDSKYLAVILGHHLASSSSSASSLTASTLDFALEASTLASPFSIPGPLPPTTCETDPLGDGQSGGSPSHTRTTSVESSNTFGTP